MKLRSLSLRRMFQTIRISRTCENLQHDFSLLALRPSAVLMNGVVKVYRKQIVYLLGDVQAFQTRVHSAFVSFKIDLSPPGRDAFSKVTLPSPIYEVDFDVDVGDLMPYQHFIEPLLCVDVEMPQIRAVSDVNQGRREDITRPDQRRRSPLSIVEEDDGFGVGSASAEFLEFVTGNGVTTSSHVESAVQVALDEVVPPSIEEEPHIASQVESMPPSVQPQQEDFQLEELSPGMEIPSQRKRKRTARVPVDAHTKLTQQLMRSWMDNASQTLNPDPIKSEIGVILFGHDPLDCPITTLGKWCLEDFPKNIKQIQEADVLHRQVSMTTEESDFVATSERSASRDDLAMQGSLGIVSVGDDVFDEAIWEQKVSQQPQQETHLPLKRIVESEESLWRSLQEKLREESAVTFSQLCPITSSRTMAAKTFYNLLSLASTYSDSLIVQQRQSFGEIIIRKI